MKITVNLDTQAVITQPSPLRFKAGCFNPVELSFTRNSQSVALPDAAVIEFSIKPKNEWTGSLLAYLNLFAPAPGNVYTGSLNCATAALLSALGVSDQSPENDVAQIDAIAEVTWSFGGQKFRSTTFTATIEPPVTDDNAAASPDPELYPAPADIARKSDIPQIASATDAITGTRADVVVSPFGVSQWFNAKLPGTPALSFLGNGSWGLPDLSGYAGSLAGDGSNVTGVIGIQLQSPFGNEIYDDTQHWVSTLPLQAPGFSGPFGASFSDNAGMWTFNSSITAPGFTGDGGGLSNIPFAQSAACDGYGTNIAASYVQQGGYYGSLRVGTADSADSVNSANSANYASNDQWGYTLFGAGNIPWNFFGDNPAPGDVLVFDGNTWHAGAAISSPITINGATERYALNGLRTGQFVKQLDNRTVYQALEPEKCGTELGWVTVGSFCLIPTNTTPLVVDNTTPALGDTIHCSQGSWTDTPTSYTYQWYRDGNLIDGATSLTYTVVAADDGCYLQCNVSATNAAGTGTDISPIQQIILTPPSNVTVPAIHPAGTPNVGDTLSLGPGGWLGAGLTTTYQWKRGGTPISGATSTSYTLTASDAGQTFTCTVTQTNIRGSASVTTAATPAVSNLVAVNTAAPSVIGMNLYVGATATCSPGTWNYHPTSYNYQWRRNGTAISSATGSTYPVVVADVSKTLSCAVSAINPAGTSSAVASAESWIVTASETTPIRGALADSSLIAHWPLSEASGPRYDTSGNGINLTTGNNSGTITNTAGKFGTAANNIPARSTLYVTDNRLLNAKTVCGWFKMASFVTYSQAIFAGIQMFPGQSGIRWARTGFSTGVAPATGQWFFLCVVLSGTNLNLWVNTQSFLAQNAASSILTSAWFGIGDVTYANSDMLAQEIGIWNRTLTDSEILTLATS